MQTRTGMFAGDPTLILDMEEKPEPAEGEVAPEVFSEIHRLTWTIGNIDRDTAIVPRGAFIVAPSHEVIKNKGYEGLDFEAAGKLESFFHFRKAELLETQSALEKQGLVRGTDFLDPVSSDSPAGCWSLQYNASKTSTTMRSLIWPGYFFFHAIETSCYGGAYIGYGQKNCDIAFMM
jgi:radial spoke head protein 9